MYRIRYWQQDTMESGRWCLTGTMSKDVAEKMADSQVYERAEIEPDSEYATCKNCAHRIGEDCEQHGGRECYPDDTCGDWTDDA